MALTFNGIPGCNWSNLTKSSSCSGKSLSLTSVGTTTGEHRYKKNYDGCHDDTCHELSFSENQSHF